MPRKRILRLLLIGLMLLMFTAGCSQEETAPTSPPGNPESEDPDNIKKTEPLVIRLEGLNAGFPSPFAHYPRMRGTYMKLSLIHISEPTRPY